MFKIFLVIFMTLHAALSSKILELDSFEDILKHVSHNTLVLCDIDNTLIEAQQHLGSVQWGDRYAETLIASGTSLAEAELIINDLWFDMLPTIPMRLVDPQGPQVLTQMKAFGAVVIGLTARRPKEAALTHPQLERFGIQFSQPLPAHIPLHPQLHYENGIIFSGEFDKKSEALLKILHHFERPPQRILFIDDKLDNVIDLETAVTNLKIEYIGIRFSKADQRVREYNQDVVDIQWKCLPQFISDEHAHSILQNHSTALQMAN